MRERQLLQCLEDVANMQYHKTKDKWWKKLAEMVNKKKKIRRWWLK